MKIISWNVNGIRACAKKSLIEFVQKEDPDILCLQETKAHPDQLDEILHNLAPYAFWSSAIKKGYSGTVTYTKTKPLSVDYGIKIKKFDSEGRFVVTEHKGFELYNTYFPNGAAREERHLFKQDFLKKFTRYLEKRTALGKNIIVAGDYNVAHKDIDVHDPKRLCKTSGFLPEEQGWMERFLTSSGFVDSFRKFHPNEADRYSWWSYRERARIANRGWRIDYICVSKSLEKKLIKADILDKQTGSDHCPVVMELK